jgi:periplasmic protein TonB
MERPAHIIIPTSHRYRLPLLALAASVQIGVAWLFMHGLATGNFHIPPDLNFRLTPEKTKPHTDPPPPPPREFKKLEITPIKPIVFDTAPANTDRGSSNGETATTGGGSTVAPPAVPDRPAVSIASTHTTPPYPVVARRTGAEGRVTLALTVAPTGRVSAAQVVTSSGSDDLDQAARQWILAHWAYRPALDHGQPVASQALATMAFNLKDAR